MRLPASVGEVDPVTGRPVRKRETGGDEPTKEERQRLRLELETRDDPSSVRPSAIRSRTDAGVAVEVTEEIRLRGGVRVEEESGREAEDPMPTVGIEKRF
jgi:hypothetical protein